MSLYHLHFAAKWHMANAERRCTECRCTICHFASAKWHIRRIRLWRMQSVVVPSSVVMLNVVVPSVVAPSVILICFLCLWYKYADREREQKRKKNSKTILPICLVSFIFYSLSNAFSKTAPETVSLSLSVYNTGHWLTQRLGECGGESYLV